MIDESKMALQFSVVIPVYNKEKYIKRAINSVLSQTHQKFEIIIIDDGSTDDSIDIAREVQDSRIKIIQQENLGVSAARNRGIKEANHDWVAFLDADDEWLPRFLEEINNLILDFPACQVAGTGFFLVNKNGEIQVNKISCPITPGWTGYLKNFAASMTKGGPLSSSSFAATKQALLQAGLYPEGVTLSEDLSLYLMLAIDYQIAYSYAPLAIYHLEAENRTWKGLDTTELHVIRLGKEILQMTDVNQEFKDNLFEFLVGLELRRAKILLYRGAKDKVLEILHFSSRTSIFSTKVSKLTKWVKFPTFLYVILFKFKNSLQQIIRILERLEV
ncbi:MAG TPA: glycosyltransferase family 2 protein [Anaerolineaceae bacterium]|jgi:glycosyltransferase involved in cell wall biosynthesis|nr:glycosyltransferase family 2 protein [Anaerolineaceae bacterium]